MAMGKDSVTPSLADQARNLHLDLLGLTAVIAGLVGAGQQNFDINALWYVERALRGHTDDAEELADAIHSACHEAA